jgi:hypothetical protein
MWPVENSEGQNNIKANKKQILFGVVGQFPKLTLSVYSTVIVAPGGCMVRPIFAVLAFFVVLPNLWQAQASKSQSADEHQATSDTRTSISLVQQSHDLDHLLPPPMRVGLLTRQAEMVSQVNPDLGREWANELFALSLQVKGNRRSQVQSMALDILIRLDPDRALELLHQLSTEDPEAKSATWPPQTQLAQRVFGILAERDGETALPVLEQEAERLGLQGHYPYAALGYSAVYATNKYWGSDNARAIRALESVFQRAFTRYSQAPRTYFDDYEFGRMLEVLAGGLPFDSVQPALHALVKNLLTTDTSKYQFTAEVFTAGGQKATAHNVIDATLLALGSLINRDPDLAKELELSRPELQRGLEFMQEGQQRTVSFGAALPPQRGQAAGEIEMYQDAVHLSHTNPAEAIAMAEQLPNDLRATALLQVARTISRNDPERAAGVIAEVQQDNKTMDEGASVDLISAQAFVAAAQNNQSALRDALRQGFAAANRFLFEQQRTGGNYFSIPALSPLVHIGMEKDPEFTMSFVDGLSPSGLKAELLLVEASALSASRPPHIGTQPQETAEKPKS